VQIVYSVYESTTRKCLNYNICRESKFDPLKEPVTQRLLGTQCESKGVASCGTLKEEHNQAVLEGQSRETHGLGSNGTGIRWN